MLQTKEINRRAVKNELKKHVELIQDTQIKNQLKKEIQKTNKDSIKNIEMRKSRLKMLIENDVEEQSEDADN
jgi:hypothetical protein